MIRALQVIRTRHQTLRAYARPSRLRRPTRGRTNFSLTLTHSLTTRPLEIYYYHNNILFERVTFLALSTWRNCWSDINCCEGEIYQSLSSRCNECDACERSPDRATSSNAARFMMHTWIYLVVIQKVVCHSRAACLILYGDIIREPDQGLRFIVPVPLPC